MPIDHDIETLRCFTSSGPKPGSREEQQLRKIYNQYRLDPRSVLPKQAAAHLERLQELTAAITARDLRRIARIVDRLRLSSRLRYGTLAYLVEGLTGLSESDWDALLYEVDLEEAL